MDPVQAKENTSEKKYRKKLLRWRTYKDGAYTYWLAFHGSNTLSCYEIEKGTNDYTVWRELRGGPRSSLVSIQISSRPTLKAAKQRALEDFLGQLSAAELIVLDELGYDVSSRDANRNPKKKRYGSRPPVGEAMYVLIQFGCEPTSRALEVTTPDGPMWEVQTTCGLMRVGRRVDTHNLEIQKC